MPGDAASEGARIDQLMQRRFAKGLISMTIPGIGLYERQASDVQRLTQEALRRIKPLFHDIGGAVERAVLAELVSSCFAGETDEAIRERILTDWLATVRELIREKEGSPARSPPNSL